MGSGLTLSTFTGLLTSADVNTVIYYIAIVFAGLIALTLIMVPLFLAKQGLAKVWGMVRSFAGGR